MRASQPTFRVIDSHTGGEPTRLIVEGGPELGNGSMAERRAVLRDRFDHFRTAICNEPRGSDVMVGGLLCEGVDAASACGIIFFNNVGYLGMCGHGTIGLVETLAYLGRVATGTILIQTPVGPVRASRHGDGAVTIENVPARRFLAGIRVSVPGYGEVTGDIAYGGNWFFLVTGHRQVLARQRVDELLAFTRAILKSLDSQNIRGEGGAVIDHVELFGPPSDAKRADSRNFVLCPGGAYDRSPCGTGTSAKIACLAADGKLSQGQVWRQESIVGTVFEASYRVVGGDVIPVITGRAHVNADVTVILDERDPFRFGIK